MTMDDDGHFYADPRGLYAIGLPRYLPVDEIERLIESCDVTKPHGIRDRAILLLLARLGLRAGFVLAMKFDDIAWSEGTLRVCGKGRREIRLPLP
mgnify:CR=1 FL=1